MNKGFGFHFNQSVLALTQGGNDARREHFRQHGPLKSMVRELGQNSLDAKSSSADGPVQMVFELRNVNTTSLPDFTNLKQHIQAANAATTELAGPNTDFQKAAETAELSTIPVLRISDYNTTGLLGQENDVGSPLAALTRTSGVSAKPRGKGGSFGIGAAAGTFNSRLLTLFWTTMAENNRNEIIFTGRADLASHKINGKTFDATGIFLDRDSEDEFKYLRNSNSFLGFEARKQPGTDTYIPAYVGAEHDPQLIKLRDCFAENFFAAFREGRLEVLGKAGDDVLWELNKETIKSISNTLEKVRPFYDALDAPPIKGDIEGLGHARLYVNLSPELTKRHHTALLRSPLMVVKHYMPRLRPNYAAVFICDNPKGNELLRSLEPPTHDNWVRNDPDYPEGREIVDRIYAFIRKSINELVSTTQGDEVCIDGLKELLPSTLGNPDLDEIPLSDMPAERDEAGEDESSTVHGDDSQGGLAVKRSTTIKPRVRRPGDSSGTDDALGGSRTRKKGKRRSEGGTKRTTGGGKEGSHRIADGDITIETWFNARSKCFYVALYTENAAKGDLTLCALGEQGIEDNYDLQILRVLEINDTAEKELTFEGNTIKDISLSEKQKEMLIKVETASKRRFRLGVL